MLGILLPLVSALTPLATSLPSSVPGDEDTEALKLAAIERAVLDYAESYYEVRPDYVERGIHPALVKAGYLIDEQGELEIKPMDFEGFQRMVQWFVDQGKAPDTGPKDVVILDAMDQTALCKLTGSWGVDYMQLAKFDGRWQTRHVVWQRMPEELAAEVKAADASAIEAAALDYVEGIYAVEPERVARSVDAGLAKYGFWRPEAAQPYRGSSMNFDALVKLAGEWNQDGGQADDASIREIEILSQMEYVAAVKVSAVWGIDYMHLAKTEGRWRIVQILWQSVQE